MLICQVCGSNFMLQQIVFPYLFSWIPPFKKAYYGNYMVKAATDVVIIYGHFVLCELNAELIKQQFIGIWVLYWFIYLIQGRKNPLMINFFTTVNPRPAFEITADQEKKRASIRFALVDF